MENVNNVDLSPAALATETLPDAGGTTTTKDTLDVPPQKELSTVSPSEQDNNEKNNGSSKPTEDASNPKGGGDGDEKNNGSSKPMENASNAKGSGDGGGDADADADGNEKINGSANPTGDASNTKVGGNGAGSSPTPMNVDQSEDTPASRSVRVKKKACKSTNKSMARKSSSSGTNFSVDESYEIDEDVVFSIVDSNGPSEMDPKSRSSKSNQDDDYEDDGEEEDDDDYENYGQGQNNGKITTSIDANGNNFDLAGDDPHLEKQYQKDQYLQEGDLVFCPWPGKNPDLEKWYWGNIDSKTKDADSEVYRYAIKFVDGDHLPEISSKHLIGIEEYKRLVRRGLLSNDEPPPKNKVRKRRSSEDGSVPDKRTKSSRRRLLHKDLPIYSPEDLYKHRCGRCRLCRKPDCGSCAICVWNAERDPNVHPMQCCFQKMCAQIDEIKKLQPCVGFSPGWSFFFDDDRKNEAHRGLLIIGPSGRRFRNTKGIQNVYKSVFCDPDVFYKHVGLSLDGVKKAIDTTTSSPSRRVPSESTKKVLDLGPVPATRSLTLEEIFQARCRYCDNCRKMNCKTCDSCIRSQGSKVQLECCLRNMCLNIPLEQKLQDAPYFPDGWTFYFDVGNDSRDGLVLFGPDKKRYRTVEKAIAQNKDAFATDGPSVLNFYDFVGLDQTAMKEETAEGLSMGLEAYKSSRPKREAVRVPFKFSSSGVLEKPKSDEVKMAKPSDELAVQTMNPTELYQQKCGTCTFCVKPDCKKCITCLLNASRTRRHKEVCLRKICLRIPLEMRRQPAEGFPTGWCFILEDPFDSPVPAVPEIADEIPPELMGLRMIAPNGNKFKSVDAAQKRYQGGLDPIAGRLQKLYEQLGVSMYKEVECDLNGEGYCREWSNVVGEKRIIYGIITKTEKHIIDGSLWCTVTYNEKSRGAVNALYNSCTVLNVPKLVRIRYNCALGGLHAYRQKMLFRDEFRLKPGECPETWIAPEMRQERLQYDQVDGNYKAGELLRGLPRLTLTIRGFQLVFTAKKSSIPNAGNGVFLKCFCMQPFDESTGQPMFVLKPGELVDLGVYAPFRVQDKKKEHIFLLKNFVHNLKCEEYCFETTSDRDEHTFDITDDWTGELHDISRRHVPAYVNEIGGTGDEIPVVHARHDCEGALHYLVGHDHPDYGPFTLVADGAEKEIFVDYGLQYEKVRLRKGFSRLTGEEQAAALKKLEQDDMEYLDEIHTFNAQEVDSSIQYFEGLLVPGKELKKSFADRSLIVAIMLKQRARAIMTEFADMDHEGTDPSSYCDNGVTEFDLPKMVGQARELVSRLFSLWNNDEVIKARLLEQEDFSKLLKEVIGKTDLVSLDATEFRNLVEHA